jgi:hypothetical protein
MNNRLPALDSAGCRFRPVSLVELVSAIHRGRPATDAPETEMAKFVYAYTGGQPAETPEAQEQAMQQWGAWFGTLGDAVADVGNPFGASKTVKSGGSVAGATSALGGYSIIEAGSLDDAAAKAAGCPVLQTGGTVEVYEALQM